jgi:hypothetical protein
MSKAIPIAALPPSRSAAIAMAKLAELSHEGCIDANTEGQPARPRTRCIEARTWCDVYGSAFPASSDHSQEVPRRSVSERERTRRDLRTSLALAWPDSPVRAPIMARIGVIDAELDALGARARRGA